MLVSERVLKWGMRFYPPLFFQRIWVKNFDKDFTGAEVKIFRSILNINYNRSIFGGTIYSAADPFYAVLFYQSLLRRGYKVLVWQKAAEIDYIKPGMTTLSFKIRIKEEDIQEACTTLDANEKFVKSYPLEITDKYGELCAKVQNVIYIRKLRK